jgi:hypothetical protein
MGLRPKRKAPTDPDRAAVARGHIVTLPFQATKSRALWRQRALKCRVG